MSLRYEAGILIQVKAHNDDGDQAPFGVEDGVAVVERSYVANPSYNVFSYGKVTRLDCIPNVFTVRQVDGAGLEWHGCGKDVSIWRHRQDDRVDRELPVDFTEQMVAFPGVPAPHRRQLRQQREQGFGCAEVGRAQV